MFIYKVAVVGRGNVGLSAVEAIIQAPDMELAGIIVRSNPEALAKRFDCPVVDSVSKIQKPHGVVLAVPSRSVPEIAPEYLKQGIATTDSYDIHGQPLMDTLDILDAAAKEGSTTAVMSAGWDPGTDSVMRAMMELMVPQGISHTDFGPGMSMGHTVAVKKIDGVKNALSMTIPMGRSIHSREVYVELEPGADIQEVTKQITTDAYFINDETTVTQVEDINVLKDVGHGVRMQRRGVASNSHNQYLEFNSRINNPAVTAQVMVSSLRAVLKQNPGAYTMMDIPLLDYLPGDRRDNIKRLC